ncbi:MAG: phospholipase D-like domain-containing protein [Thermoanaerobaculia bacterium]
MELAASGPAAPGPGKRAQRRRLAPRLRPWAGRRLPAELNASRVGRLAAAFPHGVRDAGFHELLTRIDEAPFSDARRVEVFFDGQDAFAAMLSAVESAREEILLESYIFKDDPTGRRFQAGLIAAARRGVSVRVLADGIGSIETRRGFWKEMADGGVDARLFRPIGFYPLRLLFRRDHRKILVADRTVAFTGGMNIGDEYGSSLLPRESLWRDTHCRVEGAAAEELAVVFQEAWAEAGGEPLILSPLASGAERDPRILVLDSRPGRGQKELASVFASVVAASREKLWITVAYFAPRHRALRILGGAARRGVDVRLLLPGKSDIATVRHAGHAVYSGLLSRGVRIFEYDAAILHAKTLVADGYLSVVGSSNLDFRSIEFNAECNFLILDEATGARLEAAFENDLAHATEIRPGPWKKRGWLHRAADRAARTLSPWL